MESSCHQRVGIATLVPRELYQTKHVVPLELFQKISSTTQHTHSIDIAEKKLDRP